MRRCGRDWHLLGALVVAVAIGILGPAPPAQAAFRLRVEDTDNNVGVVLTGAVNPASTPSGVITFNGSMGNFTVQITTAVTFHSGPNNYAELHLDNLSISSAFAGAANLRITVEDTDYMRGGPGPLQLVATVGGVLTAPAGSTVSVQSWANGANVAPNLGLNAGNSGVAVSLAGNAMGALPTAGSVAAFNGPGPPPTYDVFGPGAFSDTGSASFTAGASYALYGQALIHFSGAGSITSFNEDQQVLPAPTGLLLAASGVPFLSLGFWWHRKRQLRLA